ncbi:ParA family protein [[Mycoplasma] testudinis]|uniref:ParA family protein n=1 Tax=[Mycoplasma] testudinis TaxID=33924 RepID=UPI0004819FAA|nr:ParA family protein [[Mycoplasma] testudinis]
MIITITNNKGGVLKTTIAANLAKFFSVDFKKKTVIVDTDQQGNIALQFGYQLDTLKRTLADYLKNPKIDPLKCGFSVNPMLNVIASNLEISFIDDQVKIDGMIKLLKTLQKQFDVIIIDTSPAINRFIISLWMQSDKLVIPTNPEYQSVNGAKAILESLESMEFKKNFGVYFVWTRYNKRSTLHNEITADTKSNFTEFEKKLNGITFHWFNQWISNSIQNETAVAYQKLPLSFIKGKHRNIEEFASLAAYLLTDKHKRITTQPTKQIKE